MARIVTKPFPVWATFFTILGAFILFALGTWQVIRLDWKLTLLDSIAQEYAKDPSNHPLALDDFTRLEKHTLMRGGISGAWDADHLISIYGYKHGYYFYAPFMLDDGGTVLVDLGFGKKPPTLPTTKTTLTGSAKVQGSPWRFGIKNTPAQNKWVYIDMDDVRTYTNIENLPQAVFQAETISPPLDHIHQWDKRPTPHNKHLQYLLFWYGMGVLLLIVYYARFWRQQEKE